MTESVAIPEALFGNIQPETPTQTSQKAQSPTLDWFRYQVLERLKTGRNLLGVVTGEVGQGKSYWSLRVCEEFDPQFSIDKVVFDPKNFREAVMTVPKGSWLLFDEPNIGLSHRSWYSEANKVTTWFIQSSRFLQVSVIFALPAIRLMDVAARNVAHVMVIMKDRGYGVVYRLKPNYFGGSPDLYTYRLGPVRTGLPSRSLVEGYEKKRSEFHDRFFKPKDKEEEKGPEESLTDSIMRAVRKDPSAYVDSKGRLSLKKIVARHETSYTTASKVRTIIEGPEKTD